MENIKLIKSLQNYFQEHGENTSDIEFSEGNYDDNGNLIKSKVPTFCTESAEVGRIGNNMYFTFIAKAKTFTTKAFLQIRNIPDIYIYGFQNFKEDYFPSKDSVPQLMEKITSEELLQIQINSKSLELKILLNQYLKVKNILRENAVSIVNQLKPTLA
jgi:hypothetical protein